ncbi:Cell surface GPI-anchored protein ECM33 [Spathaspora sp. JA1]|nr:Cell surface GPI-anchored protein ECM33 [Spathaspora sp. JA1]
MQLKSLLLSAVAIASVFAADDDDKTTTKTTSKATSTATTSTSRKDPCSFSTAITEPTGIAELNACATLKGEITISGNAIGPIDLPSVRELAGSLTIVNSPSIVSVSLNSLQNITGSLQIKNATQLHSIDVISLERVKELQFISLPSLSNFNFNPSIKEVEKIVLSDTALFDLSGLTQFKEINYMNLNNNKNITTIDFPNLKTVTDTLILSFNHDDAQVSMNKLIWAANLTIQDVKKFSATNLTAVNGTLGFSYNTYEELKLDKLENVGQSLQIFANDDLDRLSLKKLTEIGGELKMFNNTELENMTYSFPELKRVRGALSITGDFEDLSMPSLERVQGDFKMTSKSEDFKCDKYDELKDKGRIEGHNYQCASGKKENLSGKVDDDEEDDDNNNESGPRTSSPNKESSGNTQYVPILMLLTFLFC